MPRIAINGFGRIGRNVLKAGFDLSGFDVVAINDLTDASTLAALLRRDTSYGAYDRVVTSGKNWIAVDGKKIRVIAERNPSLLPWKELGVDVVLECTGIFTNEEGAGQHVTAGAKRVIISAPSKGGNVPTYVLSMNDKALKSERRAVIDMASCTTNCTAPVMAVLQEAFGIKKALMSTVHAYTADQNIQDGPHKDLRRARAAAANIVPTTTGAAIAVTETLPALKNKFDGMAIRVPVVTGSLMDITALLKRRVTVDSVNAAFKKAAKTPRFKGILEVSDEPLVSADIVGNPASAIVNTDLTRVVDGDLVKVVAWYDNEWGYAHQLARLAVQFAKS